ncbi:MAG: hypothetical protein SZ59_C0002G0280 [candidate division TM6 bacterium GW2011_GWF2_28_16]|nr:MAG: hypothetical protein SZ59_C0002G0280 [candidate division TM6 bacterium GW2011_GWF2_28_16]
MNKTKLILLLLLCIATTYFVSSIFLLKDYGITLDEPVNFGIGHKYLNYYQTGHLDFQDNIPELNEHPKEYNAVAKKIPYMIFSLENILSAISCKLFYEKLHILNPIDAHHIIILILLLIFIFIFFFFLQKYWGNFIALSSILILLTIPRFFGHTFNNIKDIPEIIFFTITIIYFVEFIINEKAKFLYLSFIFFGFALATKMDALLIPIILFLWQFKNIITLIKNNSCIKIRTIINYFLGALISFFIFISLFPPLQPWAYNNSRDFFDKAPIFFISLFRYCVGIGSDISLGWNLYSIKQIYYTTPILILVFFILGFIFILFNKHKYKFNLLLLIWVLFPVLRHCLPKVNHYDGLRHFLIFIVPFSIITAIGIKELANFINNKFKINKIFLSIFLFFIIFFTNIYNLIETHPYQTTFYNYFTGGLNGAQDKNIPFSCDYWLNSLRSGINWLNKNANLNANITSPLLNYFDKDTFYFYDLRKDLKFIDFDKNNIPNNSYIINIPRRECRLDYEKFPTIQELIPLINNINFYDHVYSIERQNGKILDIFYCKNKTPKL